MVEYNKFTNESGIYCFKNLINNKCYIGQAINLKKRLRTHFSAYKGNRNMHLALYKAFHKYGIENFDIFIVEFIDPSTPNLKEVLDNLEKKYIKEYNSYGENGYNEFVEIKTPKEKETFIPTECKYEYRLNLNTILKAYNQEQLENLKKWYNIKN